MKIYTSYYANVSNLDSNIYFPISIAGKAPEEWNGCELKCLAPSWSIWSEWKSSRDLAKNESDKEIKTKMELEADHKYTRRFKEERLAKLDPHEILEKIKTLANGKIPVLICYETPEKFCHRHLVADWIICYSDTMFHNGFGIDTDIQVEEIQI